MNYRRSKLTDTIVEVTRREETVEAIVGEYREGMAVTVVVAPATFLIGIQLSGRSGPLVRPDIACHS